LRYALIFLGLSGLIAGCATPQPKFVPNFQFPARSPKTPDQVQLFYHDKVLAFPYEELGRIFLEVSPALLAQPAEQIKEIRMKAAEIGADGVILTPEPASFSEGSYVGGRRGGAGSSYGYGGPLYTGIAIIKK
jgi:hypothetical protein